MIYFGQDSRESGALKPQILSDYDLPKEVKAHESVVIKKLVSVEASKEETDNTIIPEKEVDKKVLVENHEPVSIPAVTNIAELQEMNKKEVKIHEVSKTEIVDDEGSYYTKAVQFHKQGRLENAISMYRKTLEYNPENFDARFNLASIYITMSRYRDAYSILLKLYSGNPADSKTVLNLAVTEIGLGKNRDALFHLQEIVEGDNELQFSVAFHKGVALSHIGESSQALVCYKNAEMINPGNTSLLLNMAVLYDKLGNYNKATDYYLKLINSDSLDSREKDKFKQRIEKLRNDISKSHVKKSPEAAIGKA